MALFQKIALSALLVALVPLSVLGLSLIRLHQSTLIVLIAEREEAHARAVADRLARELVEEGTRISSLLHLTDPTTLSDAEKTGLMRAIYQVGPDIVSVGWFSAVGQPRLPLVALDQLSDAQADAGRFSVSTREKSRVLELGPTLTKLEVGPGEMVLSPPFKVAERALPSLFFLGLIDEKTRDRIIVETGLRSAQILLNRFHPDDDTAAVLLDAAGNLVVAPEGLVDPPLVPTASLGADGRAFRCLSRAGEPLIASLARVGTTELNVLVFESEVKAFSVVRRMRLETVFGLAVSALLSIALGWVISRSLRRRLTSYAAAAQALGRGQLTTRVHDRGSDELGQLARALDEMAAALEHSRHEIEAFNRELQDRVDARTAELKAAQSRLVQAAKLSAVGQLGAGVAHEIGNPLARIIGQAQLLQLDESLPREKRETFAKIEGAAQRVSDITKSLLRFSETQGLPSETGVDLARCAEEAASLVRSRFVAAQITLTLEPRGPTVVTGKPAQLVQAAFQLLENARAATPAGGVVVVVTEIVGLVPTLTVRDTGHGIAPEHLERLFDPFFTTKTVWESPGLGLSLVYRILEEHGGEVKVTSEVAKGTSVSLCFGRTS